MRLCSYTKKKCDCTTPGCPLEAATKPQAAWSPDDTATLVVADQAFARLIRGERVIRSRLWIMSLEAGRVLSFGAIPADVVDDQPEAMASVLERLASAERIFRGTFLSVGLVDVGPGLEHAIARAIREALTFHEALAASPVPSP